MRTTTRAAVAVAGLVAGCGRIYFDPLGGGADGGSSDGSGDGGDAAAPNVMYANTFPGAPELWQIDPTTLQPSARQDLCTNISGLELGEITFDDAGTLIAFAFPAITMYRVGPDLATCTAFPITAQGVSIGSPVKAADLVPAGGVGPARVVLAATENGRLYEIDSTDGTAQLIATLAASPSGDIVWAGTELIMSTATAGNDRLVRVNPTTGTQQTIGTTAYQYVFGLAWREGTLYAFMADGRVAILDPATGATVTSIPTAQAWGGGAVR